MELIDFEKKGNAVRLYFGKNGEQIGDDWDDRPYECNAGTVYPEFVEEIYDVFFPVDIDVAEPADGKLNSEYCKNDFIYKKSWVLWVHNEYGNDPDLNPVGIFFGETLDEIMDKCKVYKPCFVKVEG